MLQPEKTCYICLEECDSKSPCECKMHVHPDCLSESHYHMPRNNCSICKSPIKVKAWHIIPPSHMRAIFRREDSPRTKTCIFAVGYFVILYLIFGWIGKGIAYSLGYEINPEWGQFWTIEHLLAFLCTVVMCSCLSNAIVHIAGGE